MNIINVVFQLRFVLKLEQVIKQVINQKEDQVKVTYLDCWKTMTMRKMTMMKMKMLPKVVQVLFLLDIHIVSTDRNSLTTMLTMCMDTSCILKKCIYSLTMVRQEMMDQSSLLVYFVKCSEMKLTYQGTFYIFHKMSFVSTFDLDIVYQ